MSKKIKWKKKRPKQTRSGHCRHLAASIRCFNLIKLCAALIFYECHILLSSSKQDRFFFYFVKGIHTSAGMVDVNEAETASGWVGVWVCVCVCGVVNENHTTDKHPDFHLLYSVKMIPKIKWNHINQRHNEFQPVLLLFSPLFRSHSFCLWRSISLLRTLTLGVCT